MDYQEKNSFSPLFILQGTKISHTLKKKEKVNKKKKNIQDSTSTIPEYNNNIIYYI